MYRTTVQEPKIMISDSYFIPGATCSGKTFTYLVSGPVGETGLYVPGK